MSKTIATEIQTFISHGRAGGWTASTVQNYEHRLAAFARCLRRRGCRRMADVTADDLNGFLREELDRGTAKSSRVGLVIIVRSLFRWLHERGRLVRDPARSLPMPDDGEADLPPPPLSEVEVESLLASLSRASAVGLRNAALLELLYSCGLRRSEALALDLEHVDLARRTIWVVDGKHGQSRLLPLMGSAASAVKNWLVMRRTLVKGADTGALFLTRDGTRMQAHSVSALFQVLNATRGPGAVHIHAHLLRHSIAVHLVRRGVDVRAVQAFLGHASLDTTKIYLRMVPGRLKEDYDRTMPEIDVGTARGDPPPASSSSLM